MRQVVGISKALHRRRITNQYHEWKFRASLQGSGDNFPSLDHVLQLNSSGSEFTPEQDKAFEEQAQKMLREQRAIRNG